MADEKTPTENFHYGTPYPRGKDFPEVFVIHSDNKNYLRGYKALPHIRIVGGQVLSLLVWVLFFFIIYGYAADPYPKPTRTRGKGFWAIAQIFAGSPAIVLVIGALVVGFYLFRFALEFGFCQRLAAQGSIYLGEMTGIHGKYDGKNDKDFFVTVYYKFRLPTGQWYGGQETHKRNDLTPTTLPSRLEKVAILYLNHTELMLL